jgi:hypothetical protein
MTTFIQTWRDAVPIIAALVGVLLGAALSELRELLASGRERRRSLNVLLFQLLELRHEIRSTNPGLVLDALHRVIAKRIGEDQAKGIRDRGVRELLISTVKPLLMSHRKQLAKRYTDAVQALVPYEPLLAYRLSGNERLLRIDRLIDDYYTRVAQRPEVLIDPKAPALIAIAADSTINVAVDDALCHLREGITKVGRARGWWWCRWLWLPLSVQHRLRLQDRVVDEELDGRLGLMIDQMLVQFGAALQEIPDHAPPTAG